MKRRLLCSGAMAAVATLAGCAGPKFEDDGVERPVLDLAAYFNGRVEARGMRP